IFVSLLLVPFTEAVRAQTDALETSSLALIPAPQQITYQQGHFSFTSAMPVAAFENFLQPAELLSEHPHIRFGKVNLIKKRKQIPKQGIRLIEAEEQDALANNAFRIVVDSSGIALTAH